MDASINNDTGKESEKNKLGSACNDALIASEARYRRLFESAKDSILILEAESKLTGNIINTVREPLIVLDNELKVIKANRSFYNFFKVNTNETIGKHIYDLGNRQWDIPKLREMLETILPQKTTFDDFEVEHDFATIGKRVMLLNARQIKMAFGKEKIILLAIEDITQRKVLEESFKEKNRITSEYLDILLNYAHAPIIIWDSLFTIKRFNHEFEKLSGYDSTEVIDKKIDILFPEDKTDSTLELLKTHLNDEKLEVFEIDILTKDKEIKTVLWNSANIFNEEGTSTVATIAQDITRRKHCEEALRISELRFRTFYENAKIGLYRTTPEGVILMANKALVKMLGYPSFEMLVERNLEKEGYEPSYNRKEFIDKIETYGELENLESAWIRQDGSMFYVRENAQAIRDSKGKTLYYDGVVEDITERKFAEEEITMLSHSLKSINECVSITDLNNKIIFINESFLKVYGYDKNELIGKDINIVRSQNNEQVHVDSILPTTIFGEWHGELFNRRKDGTEFPIQLSTSGIKDREGKILGLIGVATDITERKLVEKDLIRAKEKAEESDRLKSAFLANMSHEIRTPLNGIIGFSELLSDSFFNEDQKNEFIKNIIISGNNLLSIIGDIMDISKLESGECKIRNSQINVRKFISNIKEQSDIQVENKKIEFKLTLPYKNDVTIIFADADRLRQVFNNLISNALKFTLKGKIEIGYQLKGKMVEFFVNDTGIGIPVEQYDKIFERFRQVETSITRNFGGNGLGLAISKNLVELMGGEIWLESELGKGSAFYFTIPIYS